ncbi:hypothetical protein PG1513B_0628 [Bifidobacterium pseudolongum subsp. pseudolongum]|uniref:hypothetical protein n=1 Tax=Bifidobacterium pseudolongum TaxID=1694 RepID=UPI00101EF5A8|nr:hypothetical protein [Bifidobacterium pseudolongum]RYQ62780.1 hypothetical protein PG1513B_0628 [Bifidobacterium pseudolongum subsp. pseudolongum]
MNKKSLAGPRALTIIGSIIMLVSLMLPYATSSNDTMTAFTIAERWKELQAIADMSIGVSEMILVMLIAIAIFAVLALVFAIAAKGIPTLVFSILAMLAYIYFNMSFTPYGSYSLGFGIYLFYIAAIAAIASSIWMIAVKHRTKGTAPTA